MPRSDLRLAFGGAITLLALALLGAVVLTGMFRATDVADVVALSALPGSVVTAGVGFFFGQAANGRSTGGPP